jgi:hydroxypyruvate isomerase
MVERVGSSRVKMFIDIYNVEVAEGNVTRNLREQNGRIGRIHFADVPGRHEPGAGELNFRNLFRAIYDLPYTGWVTAEYEPTDYTFRDLHLIREPANF